MQSLTNFLLIFPDVSEVLFAADAQSSPNSGLSVSEYIAIGICSILLGLIYVASVFLYLHLRGRRRSKDGDEVDRSRDQEKRIDPEQNAVVHEEGVIKSNPLLGLRHFGQPEGYSDEGSSAEDGEMLDDGRKKDNVSRIILI